MGAWDEKSFGNDDALDFTNEILEEDDPQKVISIINEIANLAGDEELEAPDASMGVAAIEFVGAAKGAPASDFPKEALRFVQKHRDVLNDKDLKALAIKTLNRIRENSELKELWEESEYFEQWKAVMDDLLKRVER
jgi:hypothetical protein